MVHFYCFIESGEQVNADTKVFKVAVGDNQRDQVKKALVDCYANDTNAFFRIWDDATDFHLSQMMRFEPADNVCSMVGLNMIKTDIQTLYRKIVDGSLASLENPSYVSHNAFRMLSVLSPTFFIRNSCRKAGSPVPAGTRKNLSVRPTQEDYVAAVGFALIALLYWLGSLVGCIEKVVL